MKSSLQKFVISIIKQRKRLMAMRTGGKNISLCSRYIRELSAQIEAYQNKWDEEGWKNFIRRNTSKLDYLIPANKAGETIKEKLCSIAQN